MSAIIRRRNSSLPARTMTKQEFLTPFDRIFDDMFGNLFPTLANDFGDDFFTKGSYPKVNVVNYEECIEIDAAIPGISKDDVDVELTDGVLTIQGSSTNRDSIDDSQFLKREIKRSSFRRSFTLGDNLDSVNISASFDNGILTLRIPKLVPDDARPVTRKITIE
jgi:HSP20 family protein